MTARRRQRALPAEGSCLPSTSKHPGFVDPDVSQKAMDDLTEDEFAEGGGLMIGMYGRIWNMGNHAP